MPPKPKKPLPGEKRPLVFEAGRPVTDDEAWGVARRMASKGKGAQRTSADEWPSEDELILAAYRIPVRTQWRVRARADAEGLTVSEVVRVVLGAWADAPMGSEATYSMPADDA